MGAALTKLSHAQQTTLQALAESKTFCSHLVMCLDGQPLSHTQQTTFQALSPRRSAHVGALQTVACGRRGLDQLHQKYARTSVDSAAVYCSLLP